MRFGLFHTVQWPEGLDQASAYRDAIDEIVVADRLGYHGAWLTEHHFSRHGIISDSLSVLAHLAARTERIRLGTAVTVLSTDDPVRVYQRFSTLDAVSGGRAEIILGRGSFTESFPLFGYSLDDYERLFEEKVALFAELVKSQPVTWSGRTRSSLTNQLVYPPTENGALRTWIGVGGSPESVVRAARYGFPLTIAIIGGNPTRFLPFATLFRQALEQYGQAPLPMAVHSPGHVAATDEQAKEDVWPHYERLINRIGAERGWSPTSRAHFEREAGPDGALCVGSPETVATKIARTIKQLKLARFDMKYSSGTLPHDKLMTSIELFGTKVVPRVRELVS